MMEPIVKYTPRYEAEDGKIFDSREECARYEAEGALNKFFDDLPGNIGAGVIDNAPEIVAILKPFLPRKVRGPRKAKGNGAPETAKKGKGRVSGGNVDPQMPATYA